MTRILSLFVMFMLFGVLAFAQNRVVTGTVTDAKGLPVEGASIRVVGTNKGTAADVNGNFRLADVATDAKLQISGTGITTKTITTGTSATIAVSVVRSNEELTAVTVGAFGLRTSARSSGTSRSTVTPTQLTNGHPVNVAQALSGKVSGLTISNTSSSVNAAPRIVLRGLRSLTGNNTALIVIDGVQVPSSTINTLNPNDVERIDVLKGGQSATLFGSEGINGAIVITTKKGSNRKPEITLTNTINIEALAYLPRFQHSFGSGSAYGSNLAENFNPTENQQYGDHYDGSIRPLGRTLQDGSIQLLPYSDIPDGRKSIFDRGYTRQSDISYRSGDAGSNFYMSYQNLQSNGIVPGDKYQRNVLRLNAGKTYNKIGVGFDASYTFDNAPRTNNDFYFLAINAASWVPLTQYADWQNNKFAFPSNYYNDYYNNPFWEKDNNRFNTRSYAFNGNLKLDYKANNDLSFTARVGVTQINQTQIVTANSYAYSAFSKSNAFVNYFNNDYDRFLTGVGRFVARSTPITGGLTESQGTTSRINFDLFGVYDHKFNNISTRFLVGTQANVTRTNNLSASTGGIGVSGLYNFNNSLTGLFTATNSISQSRKIGAYVDATVGFRDLVFLHGSAREDYTSIFYSPAIGFSNPNFSTYGGDLSFIVSDLVPSIKNKSNKIVDQVKLTAAYNVNGNDNLNPYQLAVTYNSAAGFPYSGLLGNSVGNTLPDPGLEPEKVTSYEAGAEASLFNSRLILSGAIYRQDADKQILTVSVDPASGFQNYLLNAGKVKNRGYEADVKAIAYRSKNLTVNVFANYSYNKNEVVRLYNAGAITSFTYFETDDRASLNATVGQGFPYLKTTTFQRDAQGKVIIDPTDGWPKRADGRSGEGSTLPKHQLGVGFNIKFKNISLIANAEYRGGAVVYHDLGTDMAFTGSGAITAVYNRGQFLWPNSVYLDGSGKSVPNTSYAVGSYQAIYQGWGDAGYSRGLAGIGEVFVSSADFWKIRDVSLNYEFPDAIFGGNKIIKGASLSIFGRNLFTWLPKDNWYTDPELSTGAGNANATGVNTTLNTPPVRQFGGTLKLVF